MQNTETFLALDTETTGIGPRHHRLIEIAVLEFFTETGLPTGSFYHTYLNPEREVPPESVAVHGKTWDDLKDAPLFQDIAEDFLNFVDGRPVTIHNAPFDVGFLDNELKKAKKPLLEDKVTAIVDTCSLSRRYIRAKKHNLDALCDRYGVDRTKRTLHGALVDCEMLAHVYPKLIKEVQVTQKKLDDLFDFKMGEALSDELDELVNRHLQIDALVAVLEAEKKRYTEAVRELVQGSDTEGEFFTVEFTNRSKVNWEAVKKAHLADVDLAPYTSKSSAMYIKAK